METIDVRDDVYERLKVRKRDDESMSDLVDRLLDETSADWREGFGTLPADDATELERAAAASRKRTNDGLASRQQNAIEELAASTEDCGDDETA